MASLHNSLRFFERLKSKVTSFPTRLMVFDQLKSKKVVFVASPDFQEAVETCILEILGVERIDLTPQELIVLDHEVSFWYKKVPTWWKHPKIGRNKKTFVRIHRVFLSKEINLDGNVQPLDDIDQADEVMVDFPTLRIGADGTTATSETIALSTVTIANNE